MLKLDREGALDALNKSGARYCYFGKIRINLSMVLNTANREQIWRRPHVEPDGHLGFQAGLLSN